LHVKFKLQERRTYTSFIAPASANVGWQDYFSMRISLGAGHFHEEFIEGTKKSTHGKGKRSCQPAKHTWQNREMEKKL